MTIESIVDNMSDDEAEQLGRKDEHGDLVIYYMQQRRRALITELRSIDELLGNQQTIPTRSR